MVRMASMSVIRCCGNRSCSPANLIRSRAPISSQIAALHTRSIWIALRASGLIIKVSRSPRLQAAYLGARRDQANFANHRLAAMQTLRIEARPDLLRTISRDSRKFKPVRLRQHGGLARGHLRRKARQGNNRRSQKAEYGQRRGESCSCEAADCGR